MKFPNVDYHTPHQFVMKVYVDAWVYVTKRFVNMGNIELYEGILRYKKADYPSIPYFKSDARKEGGAYISSTGNVKKIDNYERMVVLTDGVKIPIDDIVEIEGELFNFFEGLIS